MLYYLLFFVIFLLVAQFAIVLLPFLLPLFLILFVISLFRKPNVRVYTHTYTFPDSFGDSTFGDSAFSDTRSSNPKALPVRQPREDSIDVEYTEYPEAGDTL